MVTRHRQIVLAYARATHLPPTAVVTVLAAGLAAGVGAPVGTVLLIAAAVLAGQLSVGWCNDWVDAARDLRAGRADKPVVRGEISAAGLRTAAFVALGACAVLSLAVGVGPGLVHLAAVGSAWAYDLGLKATVMSWLPYAVSFGLLAIFVVTALPGGPLPRPWVVVATSLLGVGAHLANTLPDLEDDVRADVRGFPHRLGRRMTAVLAPVVLVAATSVAAVGSWVHGRLPVAVLLTATAAAVVLAVTSGVVGARASASRAPFLLAMGVAVLCVVVLVAAGRNAVLV